MKVSIVSAALLAFAFALSPVARAAPTKGEAHTYLVTTTHTPEQCLAALDEMSAKEPKLFAKMEWGCVSGDHTGYAFVKAKDEKAALEQLPAANRANAKASEVTKFTPAQLRAIHSQMKKK